jgi:hypothetical protein
MLSSRKAMQLPELLHLAAGTGLNEEYASRRPAPRRASSAEHHCRGARHFPLVKVA